MDDLNVDNPGGRERKSKNYNAKQMGDACEMLVAAELTLAGLPAMKAPDYWPGYDLVAQPRNRELQKISVKSRTFKRGQAFVDFSELDDFDWLAIVLLPADSCLERRIFIVPRDQAIANARKYKAPKLANLREYRIDEVAEKFSCYENNFVLQKLT
jgi:hypothetical protein